MATCKCGIKIEDGEKLCILCEANFFDEIAEQVETEKIEVETHVADIPATSF